MYTAGSLFSGIGGIDLAFSRAGFDVRWQVEIEPFCRAVLTKHSAQYWPNAVQHEDVKNVGRNNLETVDVIFGGFPCQDISQAGKGRGIKKDTRSGLWFEFARIIGELRPRIVLLENVPAITTRDGTIVITQLTQMGYDAEWAVIPASAVGAPHRRERWFCVAYTRGKRLYTGVESKNGAAEIREVQHNKPSQRDKPMANSPIVRCEQYQPAGRSPSEGKAEGGMFQPEGSDQYVGNATCQRKITTEQPRQSHGGISAGWRDTQSIMGRAVDGLSRQLDRNRWPANPGQPQYRWESPRTIPTYPGRAARIKALGNAVVPQVVQPIAEAIYAILEETNTQDGAA